MNVCAEGPAQADEAARAAAEIVTDKPRSYGAARRLGPELPSHRLAPREKTCCFLHIRLGEKGVPSRSALQMLRLDTSKGALKCGRQQAPAAAR